MKADSACYSKGKDNWETPSWLFDLLDNEFDFGLDAAASLGNSKTTDYYDEELDSLKQSWRNKGTVWVNPPYSQWQKFIKKAYDESKKGACVVCLIPSRTDTVAWHELVMKSDEIRFVRRRVNFVGGNSSAPFPSAIVVFRPRSDNKSPKVSSIIVPLKIKSKQNV